MDGRRDAGLGCIDQVRALSLAAMLVVHLRDAAAQHIGWHPLADTLLFLARFATPAFVLIFGVVCGYAYLPKTLDGRHDEVARALRRRGCLTAGWALVVALPKIAELLAAGVREPAAWAHGTSGILGYYALAALTMPAWLWLIARDHQGRLAAPLGLSLWAVGQGVATVHLAGPGLDGGSGLNFARHCAFTGMFAYAQMTGTALFGAAVGLALRRASIVGRLDARLPLLGWSGLAMAGLGLACGIGSGEFSFQAVLDGSLKTPPRGWYFAFFGGTATALIGALGLIERGEGWPARALRPLGLIGRRALPIYVAHMYVDTASARLGAILAIPPREAMALALALFVAFCADQMRRAEAQSGPRRPAGRIAPAAA